MTANAIARRMRPKFVIAATKVRPVTAPPNAMATAMRVNVIANITSTRVAITKATDTTTKVSRAIRALTTKVTKAAARTTNIPTRDKSFIDERIGA